MASGSNCCSRTPNSFTIAIYWLLGCMSLFIVQSLDIDSCDSALGMQSGSILDDALTASSAYVPNVGPANARLNVERAGGAWCPKSQIEKNIREYLQVDFNRTMVLTAIETQGRFGHGRGQEYMEEYTIEYWRPIFGSKWRNYTYDNGKQILNGNSDTSTVVRNRLRPVIYANSIRILPYSVHKRTVCLRAEFYGCSDSSSIIAYNLPNKFEFSPDLRDSLYDGEEHDGLLVNGLGKLVDGRFGSNVFHFNKESAWVAWKRDSFQLHNPYVELRFEFDQIRKLNFVYIHANSFQSRGIQFFRKAKVQFSSRIVNVSDEFRDSEHEITFNQHLNDFSTEQSKNISINLFKQFAKFVRIQLFFESHWILISEVSFDSEKIDEDKEPELPVVIETKLSSVTSSILTITNQAINENNAHNSDIEIIVGILMAIVFLLIIVSVIIVLYNRKQSLNLFHHNTAHKKDSTNHNNFLIFEHQNFQNQFKNMKNILLNLHKRNNESSHISNSIINIHEKVTKADLNSSNNNSEFAEKLTQNFSLSMENMTCNDQITSNKLLYHTVNGDKSKFSKKITFYGNILPIESVQCNDYRDIELVPIPRYCLQYIEDVGTCYYSGKIRMFETVNLNDIIVNVAKTVILKNVCNSQLLESLCEVRFLASLNHPNICKVIGVCTAEQPPSIIIEYTENGDLVEFLNNRLILQQNRSTINEYFNCHVLYDIAIDIASAMLYLETRKIVHKDLAARNCLMTANGHVKVADIAITKPQYNSDYIIVDDSHTLVPIRWLPWESILLDKYTCSSVMWSFGVVLWEIMSFAVEKPFYYLNDTQVLQNAECMFYGGELQVRLTKPDLCPVEIYDFMCECWRRDDNNRPNFFEVYHFLKKFRS